MVGLSAPSTGGVVDSQGIRVSIISPIAYLELFTARRPPAVHHVAAHQVLQSDRYREFFREQQRAGAEIVLDNGVFELGYSLPMSELINAARLVGAGEIILPDVRRRRVETIELVKRALYELDGDHDLGVRLCAVVQGENMADWLTCYEQLHAMPQVGSIALPATRKRSDSPDIALNRELATAYLADHGLIDPTRRYRLLGLGYRGHLELAEQRRFEWIESVDCATPVILGALGVQMLDDGPFEKLSTPRVETFEHIPADRHELIRRNIDVLRRAAGDFDAEGGADVGHA